MGDPALFIFGSIATLMMTLACYYVAAAQKEGRRVKKKKPRVIVLPEIYSRRLGNSCGNNSV